MYRLMRLYQRELTKDAKYAKAMTQVEYFENIWGDQASLSFEIGDMINIERWINEDTFIGNLGGDSKERCVENV